MKIMSRWDTTKILYEDEKKTLRESVVAAVAAGTSLNDASLNGASLNGASLNGASLSGASLNGAILSGASLNGAILNDAILNGAILNGASLNGASLNGASLNGASLNDAILDGARLDGILGGVPLIEDIDAAILVAIEQNGNQLNMKMWHTCETTHCRAGWAIHLAGKKGYELEERYGPAMAGTLLYLKAGATRIPNWVDTDENALADMRERAGIAP